MKRITQAIILAAGEGQRLKPFTKLIPKVMLPIAGRPILEYVIESLASNGVRRIILIVGYRKEQVQNYFADGKDFGVEIRYVVQRQQLGTAHALNQARDLVDDRFLVLAGDNIIEAETIASLVTSASDTMLIKKQEDTSKYGAVIVRDGLILKIIEKPREKVSSLVNTGIYALNKEVFTFMNDEVGLTAVIERMIAQGHEVVAEQTDGPWLDAAYPWDILKLNDLTLRKISPGLGGTIENGVTLRGLVSVEDKTIIRSGSYIVGPVIIGKNCEIGPGACIFPSTSIGNSVVVSPFSIIKNSSIGNNVTIGPNSSVQDSVIAPGVVIGSHFAARRGKAVATVEGEYHRVTMGAIIGNYCEFGDNDIVEPGVIIGNDCRVKALKVLSQNIPDGSLVV